MALKGDLRDFPIASLFNLVNLAGKTGMLVIQSRGRSASVYFREGKLIRVAVANDASDLAGVLQKCGKLTAEQAAAVRERARAQSDKEQGLLLIGGGYCHQRDIVQAVKSAILEQAYSLFAWLDGSFAFEPGVAPPEDQMTISLGLESIIIEGTRRIKEWKVLQDDLPSLDVALSFVAKPTTNLKEVQLSVEEWRVLSHVNPKNTVRQIAKSCNMDELHIRKTVYRLLQAGLVQVARHESRPPARTPGVPPPSAATSPPAAQPASQPGPGPRNVPPPPGVSRSLVQKLIFKIKSLGV